MISPHTSRSAAEELPVWRRDSQGNAARQFEADTLIAWIHTGAALILGLLASVTAGSLVGSGICSAANPQPVQTVSGNWLIALTLSGAASAGSHLVAIFLPRSLFSRLYNGFAAMFLAALFMHFGKGEGEAHFPFFILISFLLYYRDWRPIIFAITLICTHHVILYSARDAGLPIILFGCLTLSNLLVHLAAGGSHSIVLAYIARRMRAADDRQRHLQDALQFSNNQLRILFDDSPDPAWIIEGNRFIDCNLAAVRFLGYAEKKDLTALHPADLSPQLQPDGQPSLAKAESMMEMARTQGVLRFEWVHKRADASEFLAEVTLSVISLLGKPALFCIGRDITDKHRLQEELRTHRDHLQDLVEEQTKSIKAIVDTAADGIITIDHRGTVLTFNAAAKRMFGYAVDEVLGNNISLLMPEPHRSMHDGYMRRYADGGEARVIGIGREAVGRRKDGSTFPLYLAVSEMEISGEKRFTGIIRDISRQKEVEADLIKAREAAEAASRAKSNFLANMSHEIRTPMNAIIGMTDLVLDTPLERQQEKLLRSVAVSAKSLLTILNDILDLSKLESGKMVLESIPFSIRAVIEGVEDVIKIGAASKGLAVEIRFEGELPPCVLGDPTRLRQVLLNLAGNAVKFTERGRITLSARPGGNRGEWHFSVRDTGIGISRDRIEKVFERFSQADESTTRRFGGTGLGTSISREIVECMGGRIWAESEEGQGSDFQFTAILPPAAGITECSHCVQQHHGRAPHTRPLKILLAEDIPLNQELAVLRLGQRQHQVTIAENGRIAVEKFGTETFDLILMDVMMPEMDGGAATQAIRAIEQEHGGHIPIIMLTASVMQTDQKHYVTAGADDFVGKPIDFAELYTKIARFFPVVEARPEVNDGAGERKKLPLAEGLDVHAGVAIWGEEAVYRRALLNFKRDYGRVVETLRDMFGAGHHDGAKLLAHTIKGLAGNLAAKDVSAAFAELERLAAGQSDDWTTALRQAQARLETMLCGIDRFELAMSGLDRMDAPPDAQAIVPHLLRLIESLLNSKLDEEAIVTLRQSLDAKRFGHLEDLIDAFEFSKAAAYAMEIKTEIEGGNAYG